MDRRQFLGRLAMGCSAAASPLVTPVALASAPWEERLVVVILRGAMDGLDAVRPVFDPAYAPLRPTLAQGGLDVGAGWALHPALEPLLPLWRAGELGAVHAVSTPYRDRRSHFDGQDILEAGSGSAEMRPSSRASCWRTSRSSESMTTCETGCSWKASLPQKSTRAKVLTLFADASSFTSIVATTKRWPIVAFVFWTINSSAEVDSIIAIEVMRTVSFSSHARTRAANSVTWSAPSMFKTEARADEERATLPTMYDVRDPATSAVLVGKPEARLPAMARFPAARAAEI